MTAQATPPHPLTDGDVRRCQQATDPHPVRDGGGLYAHWDLPGAFASKWFLLLPALVSGNQLLMAARGWCPMSLLLTRLNVGTGKERN